MTADERPFASVLPWILFTSFIFLVTYQARAIFGPLLPYIEAEFHISHAEATRYQMYIALGYSVSMFATVYTTTLIAYRNLVGVAAIISGAALFAIALTPGKTALIFLCVVLGLATGQYFNAGMGTLRSLASYRQWSKTVAIHEFGPNLSFLLCPIVAVIGARHIGWRGVIAVLGVISLLAGLGFLWKAQGGEGRSPKFFFKGVARLFRNPMLWLFVWMMSLMIGGQFGPYSIMTLHLTEECGLSAANASGLLSSSRLAAPFAVFFGGWLTVRFGTIRALTICLVLHSLSLFCLAMAFMPVKIAGLFLQPMMASMTAPAAFTLIAERFPARKQASALAVGMPLASFIGTGAMPSVLGWCGTHASFSAGFMAMGIFAALSLPLLVLAAKKKAV